MTQTPLRFDIITLFPEMFQALNYSIVQRAQSKGAMELHCWNPRDYTDDPHRRVDDRPYGGGPGMLLQAPPIAQAIYAAKQAYAEKGPILYLSPQGKPFTQQKAQQLSQKSRIFLIAGHYEGVDQRLIDHVIDEEISIGDYVLSGGEFAVMVVIDAITRLLPNVLGHEESATQDSFVNGLLDCPHYTRPPSFQGTEVPAVLLSGDHEAIRRWRLQQALGQTWLKRRDLLAQIKLTSEQEDLLNAFIDGYHGTIL